MDTEPIIVQAETHISKEMIMRSNGRIIDHAKAYLLRALAEKMKDLIIEEQECEGLVELSLCVVVMTPEHYAMLTKEEDAYERD